VMERGNLHELAPAPLVARASAVRRKRGAADGELAGPEGEAAEDGAAGAAGAAGA